MEAEDEKVWEEFWKPIVCREDGSLDVEKVKNELLDFREVMLEVAKVYDSVTNGKFTKPNTNAEYVIDEVEARIQEGIQEALKDFRKEDLEEQINQVFKAKARAHMVVLGCEDNLAAANEALQHLAVYRDRTRAMREEEAAAQLEIERLQMVIEARKVSVR